MPEAIQSDYYRTYPESLDNFGYDRIRIEKSNKFKDYDLFVRDNMYFGDNRYNCTHSKRI